MSTAQHTASRAELLIWALSLNLLRSAGTRGPPARFHSISASCSRVTPAIGSEPSVRPWRTAHSWPGAYHMSPASARTRLMRASTVHAMARLMGSLGAKLVSETPLIRELYHT